MKVIIISVWERDIFNGDDGQLVTAGVIPWDGTVVEEAVKAWLTRPAATDEQRAAASAPWCPYTGAVWEVDTVS